MGNGKKTFAKAAAMLMAATSMFSVVGCDLTGGDDHSDKTHVKIENFGGGVGVAWLNKAIDDFMTQLNGKQYEEGKDVYIEIVKNDTHVHVEGMQSSGTHMYFVQDKYSDLYNLIQSNAIFEITDVVTRPYENELDEDGNALTIEAKMDARYRFAMQGTGDHANKYYLLPHYEMYAGASYDVDLFSGLTDYSSGFYLATPNGGTKYKSKLVGKDFYFTDEDNKTVGNDGIAGTDDDGMPTTLDELVAMCEYIKYNEVFPFSAPGGHIDYANYLIESLWTALAGYEQRAAVTTLSGTVDYVTGVNDGTNGTTKEELWKGTGIYTPIIEEDAQVTLETGYKAINQAGRYYAFAFMELAQAQGWFYDGYLDGDYNHKSAMRSFILNGLSGYLPLAAHVEGTYWYNEAESYNLFNDYKTYSGGKSVKNIGHWHMPTSVNGEVVTGTENAREEAAINTFTSTVVVNGNIDDKPGNEAVIEVCKDFLHFLYSEKQMKQFSALTGVSKAFMDYPIDKEVLDELDPYQQTVMRLRENNRVVQQYGDNDLYRNFSTAFVYSVSGPGYAPVIGTTEYSSILTVFANKPAENAWTMFKHLGQNEGTWAAKLEEIGKN